MPVVGLIHPVTRKEVSFDYFNSPTAYWPENGAVNERPSVAPWVAALFKDVDPEHEGYNLTVSGMYSCPRESFIKALYAYYVNPWDSAVRDIGSLGHVGLQKYMPDTWRKETRAHGELLGAKVSGKTDAWLPHPGDDKKVVEIIDAKFPRHGSAYYRGQQNGVAKAEHAVQLNANRLLLEQNGLDTNETLLTLWDHALGSSRSPSPPEALRAPHMTEEDIAVIHPFGYDFKTGAVVPGTYNVRQIVDLHSAASEEFNSEDPKAIMSMPEERDAIVAKIPLVGERMMGGQKCSIYCDVEPICSRLCREYGKPACTAT